MYPILAKTLSEAHGKVMISLVIRIDFDTKRISAGEIERIADKTILGDCTVVDVE